MALLSTSIIARERISPVLITLRANPTFMSGLVAWAIAQVLKVFTKYWVERKWDWKMLVGSGGMPSSHSALCVGLTTAVALCHGVGDSLFPVCLGFTLIVMYDAAGVRRHAGRQAEVLNMIVQDLFEGHPVSEKKLKELLGHTPLQVGAGAILGIVCGFLCSRATMIY
jgi:acid phosphatase family membrane protein YuiD